MKHLFLACVLTMLFGVATAWGAEAEKSPLRLKQTIPLPDVSGGFNHLGADARQKHLFLTATRDAKLDVLDLDTGKLLRRIEGPSPAAATFAQDLRQILVTRGAKLYVYDGSTFEELAQVDVGASMDELHYDAASHRVYVGCMTAGQTAIAVVDVPSRKLLGKIKLPAKPQGFAVESEGSRIYVNVPSERKIIVLDRKKQEMVDQWEPEAQGNYPIALDEANHRLFVGCRRPAKLVVFDTSSAKPIASVGIVSDTDDMAFDVMNKRIYVCGGEGGVSVIAQQDADHYSLLGNVDTAPGARNSILVSELGMFFVAVPQREKQAAQIRVYEVRPGK